MPDILNYRIIPTGGAPAPQFDIEATVVDSANQSVVLKDLVGNRALTWPAAYTTLTDAQQETLRELIGAYLVRCATGQVDSLTGR